jgi:hypothetical protein
MVLIGVGALHAVFMVLEIFPWGYPMRLRIVSKKRLKDQPFTKDQREGIATIVHNAACARSVPERV